MTRIILLIAALAAFSLTACGGDSGPTVEEAFEEVWEDFSEEDIQDLCTTYILWGPSDYRIFLEESVEAEGEDSTLTEAETATYLNLFYERTVEECT